MMINILCFLGFIFYNTITLNDNYFEVMKAGVLHKFAHGNADINFWVQKVFPQWENETFKVFQQVADKEGIALDLGAWIGTTAIWLSKNFTHVIAVDADYISLAHLVNNLKASECSNVTICDRPVAYTNEEVIFGSRSDILNNSVSYIKPTSDKAHDYKVMSITFKQLMHDYVYSNANLSEKKVSFIKCDIEGGEEDIIEDLLVFAYYNKVKVYLSFHHDWWRKKRIGNIEHLFKFFTTDCPQSDICAYIYKNPFASLLFSPRNIDEKPLMDKYSDDGFRL